MSAGTVNVPARGHAHGARVRARSHFQKAN